MTDGDTTRYIEDFCIFRIRHNGLDLQEYQHVGTEPFNEIARRIRQIGEEIENSNPDFFSSCCEQLNLSQTTAYVKFRDLADELFRDQENGQRGISWGRIAALITFSGRLALHCATNNLEMLVSSVIGWTARYIDDKLRDWMVENQGWEGFMLFFDKDQAQERQEEALADVLGQALRYTAVGAGIVAGLAMFLRR